MAEKDFEFFTCWAIDKQRRCVSTQLSVDFEKLVLRCLLRMVACYIGHVVRLDFDSDGHMRITIPLKVVCLGVVHLTFGQG